AGTRSATAEGGPDAAKPAHHRSAPAYHDFAPGPRAGRSPAVPPGGRPEIVRHELSSDAAGGGHGRDRRRGAPRDPSTPEELLMEIRASPATASLHAYLAN